MLKGNIFDLDLTDTTINFQSDGENRKIFTTLSTNGEVNFTQIKKVLSIFYRYTVLKEKKIKRILVFGLKIKK